MSRHSHDTSPLNITTAERTMSEHCLSSAKLDNVLLKPVDFEEKMITNNQLIDLSHRESSLKSTQSATNSKDESLLRAFDDSQPSP